MPSILLQRRQKEQLIIIQLAMNIMIMMMKIMMTMTLNNPGAIIFNRTKWGQLKEQLWADYHNDAFSSRHSRVMSLQPYKCSTFTHNITQKSKKTYNSQQTSTMIYNALHVFQCHVGEYFTLRFNEATRHLEAF